MEPGPPRRILHLDIDAFLASVEQILDPTLRGRPVAVGAGVVASCSYEARARGVRTAMPLARAHRLCPGLVLRDGDSRVAARFRERVGEIAARHAPVVEVSSLDDLYADLTGLPGGARAPLEAARRIREEVRARTGLSISQGIGATRAVARLATRRAKPAGIFEVPDGEERAFLAGHLVRDIPGVGEATARTLAEHNIHTVEELLLVDRDLLRRTFGARGEELFWRIRALEGMEVRAGARPRSVCRETTLAAESDDPSLVEGMLGYLVDRAASEARALGLAAGAVAVRIRYADFRGEGASRALPEPTARTDRLLAAALDLLRGLWRRRVLVRLVGVTLEKLGEERPSQGELFRRRLEARRRGLDRAVDAVRARHGFGSLVRGPAIALLGRVPQSPGGFVLRTPSLSR